LIKRIPNYFSHRDDRGSIRGIINFGTWEEMNFITSDAGTVRGNHYHKYTKEAFLILEGEINIMTKNVKTNKKFVDEEVVKQGDFFIIEPFILHTFRIIKDSKWLNLLSHKMGDDDDKDFYRE
jgi:dTDP-4-dehydrorhamnose 3,5-epimerase-like enzyme